MLLCVPSTRNPKPDIRTPETLLTPKTPAVLLAHHTAHLRPCSDRSGLRLEDVYAGLGAATKDGDRLRVRYTVYLTDGTIVSRGQVLHLASFCTAQLLCSLRCADLH